MPELETVIVTRLEAYESLSALVGTRIYPLILPQSPTLPAVTYQRTDGPRDHCMDADSNVASPRFAFDSWASTYAGAKAVATQVREALQRWADADTDPVVLDSLIESDEDLYEPDTGMYHVRSDWTIWHYEGGS